MSNNKNVELEIKNLAIKGMKTQDIANSLHLCRETVRRKLAKLGIEPLRGKSNPFSLKEIPEDLKQLVLGSLLGDGTFTKACSTSYCMIIAHSEKQLKYLQFKEEILKKYNLSSRINQIVQYDKRYKHNYTVCRLKSRTNSLFREIREMFYKGSRKEITDVEIFNELSPLGLAIWYLDDGYVTYGSCIFSTVSIPTEAQEKLAEILLKKYDLHFTTGHNNNSMYLCSSDFQKFKNLILPFVTNDLQYKLVPYKDRVLDKSDELLESCDANQQPSLESA